MLHQIQQVSQLLQLTFEWSELHQLSSFHFPCWNKTFGLIPAWTHTVLLTWQSAHRLASGIQQNSTDSLGILEGNYNTEEEKLDVSSTPASRFCPLIKWISSSYGPFLDSSAHWHLQWPAHKGSAFTCSFYSKGRICSWHSREEHFFFPLALLLTFFQGKIQCSPTVCGLVLRAQTGQSQNLTFDFPKSMLYHLK